MHCFCVQSFEALNNKLNEATFLEIWIKLISLHFEKYVVRFAFLTVKVPTKVTICHKHNAHIYSYFEKGCRKKCTRQSRKVLWVVLSSLFFKKNWKNGTREPMDVCLRVLEESNKSRFDSYSVTNSDWSYPILHLSRLSRAYYFGQPFSK